MDRVRRMPLNGGYDTAQICLNGHEINDSFYGNIDHNQKYCKDCGAKTIINCLSCEAEIRGHYKDGMSGAYMVPSYCHNCGKPYPWTERQIKAAQDLVDELEKVSKKNKELLKASIEDLVNETPKTIPAAIKFKKIISKAGGFVLQKLYDELYKIASEGAIKVLKGNF